MKHIENGVRTRKPVKKVRSKPRPGRLKGHAMGDLRRECYERDLGRCVICDRLVYWSVDPICDDSYHMAHLKAKRIGGDSLDNVQTECGACHRKYHAYGPSRSKPCKSKQSVYESPDAGPIWDSLEVPNV